MEPAEGGTPGENRNLLDCPPTVTDARRRKMPPEFSAVLASEKKTKQVGKVVLPTPPPPQPTTSKKFDLPVDLDGNTSGDEALQAFATALDTVCGDDEVPESTPENAPFDLVLDFMGSIMKEDFEQALKLATMILKYEPMNATVAEYLPILHELIQLDQEESDSSCTTDDSDETNSETESCASLSEDVSEEGETDSSETEEEDTRDEEGQSEVTSVTSESTVASDEYLSEYGEDDDLPPIQGGEDDGYETNETSQRHDEAEEE